MIKESIKELISAIAEGDTLAIEDSFNTVMSYKIADRLDSMRVDVAQSMFGSVVEESVELEEELNLEDYSVEELEDFMMSEDFEQLDEVSKKTLGSYVTKAHDQLMKHTAAVNMKTGRGDKDAFAYSHDTDTMRKEKNRKAGISTAIGKLTKKSRSRYFEEVELEELTLEDYSVEELEQYMMSEDFEQLDELSRKTLSSYIGKARSSKTQALKDYHKAPEGSDEREKIGKKANNRTDGKELATDTLRGKTNKDRAKKGLPTRYYTEEIELEEAVTASQLIANHNSSDHGGAQHFSNVDGKHHSWNYVKKNKEGSKYEVTTDKNEAEGIALKGKFLKLKK